MSNFFGAAARVQPDGARKENDDAGVYQRFDNVRDKVAANNGLFY